jgi:hypothetical protein
MAAGSAASARPIELFVSTEGNDKWSGRRPAPNRAGTDGPLRTPHRALVAARAARRAAGKTARVRIVLRGGTYLLRRPLVIAPADAAPPEARDKRAYRSPPTLTIAAYPGEEPILSGGRRIAGWRPTTVNGRRAWVTRVPAVRNGTWTFRQLWVNGRRARRPRRPAQGLFRIAALPDLDAAGDLERRQGQDRFVFHEGDLANWRNLGDVEFVALHFWIATRRRFRRIDGAARTAVLDAPSRMRLTDDHTRRGAEYYVDNVFEALAQPGQWYLDRPAGRLYYLPRRGERIETAEAYAPVLQEVLRVGGEVAPFAGPRHEAGRNAGRPVAAGRPVEAVRFEGLTVCHCHWQPSDAAERLATPQAACHVPAAVMLENARDVTFADCRVAHVGGYGIELAAGCRDVEIRHSRIHDLGAGGVKIWHRCRRNTVADCEIADGGHLFHAGVGVLVGRSSGNTIIHNHIHDFDYTGISVGWTWGYAEGDAYGNVIEYNRVHDIGRGMLSDLAGIYTLGVQPGTRIRYNVFHDVVSRGYGGWGIYTDEGSTLILIENNLVYRTKSGGFHQHYGCSNLVRNNILALGAEAQVQRTRVEDHRSFVFRHNIVYADNDGTLLSGNWDTLNVDMDHNLYFNASGRRMDFAGRSLARWRQEGADAHSLVADPRFAAPAKGDFRLKRGSPAGRIGFRPFDLSTVGPRRH